MSPEETGILTEIMLRSGKTIDLSGIPGPFVDKHSTGGVGDKTSLILAPIVAACGVRDPMMSGRALGHTGGTLDKLESIPGYRTNLSIDEFREYIERDGFAMTGQTKEIVPADRLLYALRDVSATVESIPLITASILSKKVAEGAEALVFDVKFGSGAFMKNIEDCEKLARSLVNTGKAMGKNIIALLTDMNEPLGNMVGNFLEVEESLDCLEGKGPTDLMTLTLALAARMLILGGKAGSIQEAEEKCQAALDSGKARELFMNNVRSQGGDPDTLESMRGTYRSDVYTEIKSENDAYISRIDAYKTGLAGIHLGVGRNKTEDSVSPLAGVQLLKKGGAAVSRGTALMKVWARDKAGLEAALPLLQEAIVYSDSRPAPRKLIEKEIRS